VASATSTPPEVTPRPAGPLRRGVTEVGELVSFGGRSVLGAPGAARYLSQSTSQLAKLISGTTLLMFAMNCFLGASDVSFGYFFLNSIGAGDYSGLVTGLLTPRAAITLMFGYVFAAKVAAGWCAELGAMKVQQEIDALDSVGVDPMRYAVAPRIIAAALFAPLATLVSIAGQTAGGWLVGVVVLHGLSAESFLSVHWSSMALDDPLKALVTILLQAVSFTVIACFYGLRAQGGPAGVGQAVARSLFVNLIVLHLLQGFFLMYFYGDHVNLAIGG
jgi:phospholipid/cholesterol/gamma-HCH transport system permease protein